MKEDLTMKQPQKLEEILDRARHFVKLVEENTHHWRNVSMGKDSQREISRRVERDQSIVRDPTKVEGSRQKNRNGDN